MEIVEKSILGGGTVAEFGLGKEFQHGRGEQVRGGMSIDFERLRILLGDDAQIGVRVERPGEVNQIAVRLGGKSGVGKTRTDGLGNVECSGALRDFRDATVGELNMNAVRHE
jgi:hypothetical protein